MVANSIMSLPIVQLLSCVAKSIDSTISVGFSFDAEVLFPMQTLVSILSLVKKVSLLSHTTGYGFDLGLLGVGIVAGVSVSNSKVHGGLDTVGSSLKDPNICFSIGYTPFLVGGAITFLITPSAVGTGSENNVVSRISGMIAGTTQIHDGDVLSGLLGLFGACADVPGWYAYEMQ